MTHSGGAGPLIPERRPKVMRRCLGCDRRFLTVAAIRLCRRCRTGRTMLALGDGVAEASVVVPVGDDT